MEHRFLNHRPLGPIQRLNLSNPVSSNFTPAAPFYKALDLPILSPHQYSHFTKATTRFLAKVFAKRDADKAAKIAGSASGLADEVLKRLIEIEEVIIMAKLRKVQSELDERVGSSCPNVIVNILEKKISILQSINFEGGKAQIKVEDFKVVTQVCKCISYLYEIVGEEEMIHVRVDGHVQDTGKPVKCLIISYCRAAEIVRNIANYVPKKFLHPFGYGGTRPISKTDASENRRVEISLIVNKFEVLSTRKEGTELWNKIRPLKEFDKLTADPAFAGDVNTSVQVRQFAPNLYVEEEEEEEGSDGQEQERPIVADDEFAPAKTLKASATAPALL